MSMRARRVVYDGGVPRSGSPQIHDGDPIHTVSVAAECSVGPDRDPFRFRQQREAADGHRDADVLPHRTRGQLQHVDAQRRREVGDRGIRREHACRRAFGDRRRRDREAGIVQIVAHQPGQPVARAARQETECRRWNRAGPEAGRSRKELHATHGRIDQQQMRAVARRGELGAESEASAARAADVGAELLCPGREIDLP